MLTFSRRYIQHTIRRSAKHPHFYTDLPEFDAKTQAELEEFYSPEDVEKMKKKYTAQMQIFANLPHERKMAFVQELKSTLKSGGDEDLEGLDKPSPEEKAEYQGMINEIMEEYLPKKKPTGTPHSPNQATPDQFKAAFSDPSIREAMNEDGIVDATIDDLLAKMDRLEKVKDTPEAEKLINELKERLNIQVNPDGSVREEDFAKMDQNVDLDEVLDRLEKTQKGNSGATGALSQKVKGEETNPEDFLKGMDDIDPESEEFQEMMKNMGGSPLGDLMKKMKPNEEIPQTMEGMEKMMDGMSEKELEELLNKIKTMRE